MLQEDDPFRPFFEDALGFNFDATVNLEASLEWEPEPPLTFYDGHLDTNLLLKCVKRLRFFNRSLSHICDTAISAFCDKGHIFNAHEYIEPRRGETIVGADAHSIARYYKQNVGGPCSIIASKTILLPRNPTWESAFYFLPIYPEVGHPGFLGEGVLHVRCKRSSPHDLTLPDGVRPTMEDSEFLELQDLARKFPRLATWELFPMTRSAHLILQKMDDVPIFPWSRPRTTGHMTVAPLPRPADARTGELRKILNSSANKTRRGTKNSPDFGEKKKPAYIVAPSRLGDSCRPYRSDFRHFLQHAWTRAVLNDTTFMIFHCGNFERIGIRHRETQTLFLSDLIDTTNCKDPPYGKLHLGLYIAILQDALERRKEAKVPTFDKDKGDSKKRKINQVHSGTTPDSSKKQRRNLNEGITQSMGPQNMEREMSLRDLALIRLDYGPYRSPAPSSFIRLGSSCSPGLFNSSFREPKRKSKYRSHEYFSLTLTERLARGAIGLVHEASVTLETASGGILQRDLIVKLAFSGEERKRLRNEYAIYQHLASAEGVEGIINVHGLFRDMDTGALALFMDHAGVTLKSREKERLGTQEEIDQIHTSPEERETFMRAIKSIHKAGVRHRDLRADNLTIDADGQCFIIDFDLAELNSSEKRLKWELSCMEKLLDGAYDDPESQYC